MLVVSGQVAGELDVGKLAAELRKKLLQVVEKRFERRVMERELPEVLDIERQPVVLVRLMVQLPEINAVVFDRQSNRWVTIQKWLVITAKHGLMDHHGEAAEGLVKCDGVVQGTVAEIATVGKV